MKSAAKIVVSCLAMFVFVISIACGDNRKADHQSITEKATGTAGAIEKSAKDAVAATDGVMTDAWITASINTSFLGEELLKNSDIDVDTSDHVVTLAGTVTSKAGKARAVEVAKATDGVNDVVDHLRIGKKSKPLPPKN